MCRGPRLDDPGVLHHLMGRDLERRGISWGDTDRAHFMARLAASAEQGAFTVLAWPLLPKHARILVRCPRSRPSPWRPCCRG